jgi:RNA polymerase sigma-70 factor (ECF subfamily)
LRREQLGYNPSFSFHLLTTLIFKVNRFLSKMLDFFRSIVNKPCLQAFMCIEDDSKEKIVTPAAANIFIAAEPVESESRDNRAGSAAHGGLDGLFREHHKGIFRVAYRITGSESDAEDVLQTIFVRLTPGWDNRDLSPNPRAFLYRAAINASLDVVRRRQRINAVPLEVVDFEPAQMSAVSTPADEFADSELRELIRQAVAKLEGRAATAFVLRYYEGYDNAQIAEVLGTSQMVIAVTLHRARTRLRKEIGSYLEKHHEAQ